MIDLDKASFNIECPSCSFWNSFTFKQARVRDVIICRGCKINIQLDDQMNQCKKAEREMRRQLLKLQESLDSLNLTIRL